MHIVHTDDGLATQEKVEAKGLILHFLNAKVKHDDLKNEQANARRAESRRRLEQKRGNLNETSASGDVPVVQATAVPELDKSTAISDGAPTAALERGREEAATQGRGSCQGSCPS